MDASPALRRFLLSQIVQDGSSIAEMLRDERLVDEFVGSRTNLA